MCVLPMGLKADLSDFELPMELKADLSDFEQGKYSPAQQNTVILASGSRRAVQPSPAGRPGPRAILNSLSGLPPGAARS